MEDCADVITLGVLFCFLNSPTDILFSLEQRRPQQKWLYGILKRASSSYLPTYTWKSKRKQFKLRMAHGIPSLKKHDWSLNCQSLDGNWLTYSCGMHPGIYHFPCYDWIFHLFCINHFYWVVHSLGFFRKKVWKWNKHYQASLLQKKATIVFMLSLCVLTYHIVH